MENKNLKETIIIELKLIYQMIKMMEPKNAAEFIAIALPNLHLALFAWRKSKQEEIEVEMEKTRKEITHPQFALYEKGYNKALDDLKPIISNLLK